MYRINTPTVVSEEMDGEAVLIHFKKGCYYSVEGVGAIVVRGITEGDSSATLASEVAAIAAVPVETALVAIERFQRELLDEDIVAYAGGSPPAIESTEQTEFSIPSLEKFTDLEDLLLLDPIHDVDAAGWPKTNPADEGASSTTD